MDRKEFLKFLGIGSVDLVLPTGPLLSGPGLLPRPVKIYDNYINIKGVEYNDLWRYFKEIKVGDAVVLAAFSGTPLWPFRHSDPMGRLLSQLYPAFENIVLTTSSMLGRNCMAWWRQGIPSMNFGVGVWTGLIVNGKESPPKLSGGQGSGFLQKRKFFISIKRRNKTYIRHQKSSITFL